MSHTLIPLQGAHANIRIHCEAHSDTVNIHCDLVSYINKPNAFRVYADIHHGDITSAELHNLAKSLKALLREHGLTNARDDVIFLNLNCVGDY